MIATKNSFFALGQFMYRSVIAAYGLNQHQGYNTQV